MKKSEELTEGWVKFTRLYCTEGYIDKWRGDSINDPNRTFKHKMCVNSTSTYWRCNDSEWVHDGEIRVSSIDHLIDVIGLFTAVEIWDEASRLSINTCAKSVKKKSILSNDSI
jgi:hypothetical protein